MARGKHRLPVPVRLLAATAAALTVVGIVVATGTASAGNAARSNRAAGEDDPACRNDRAIALRAVLAGLRGEQPQTGRLAALALRPRADDGDQGRDCDDDEDRGDENGDDENDDERENDERENEDVDDEEEVDDEEFPGREQAGGPFRNDFVDIEDVSPNVREPEEKSDASTGTFTSVCGTNEEGHRNSDNYMQAPGKVNAAQHVHDYIGNVSTDAFSDDGSLADADTTCERGDRSAYFWPVLRDTDKEGDDADENGGGLDGNVGEILEPRAVDLEFGGSPVAPVEEMPRFLRLIVGDAKAVTNGDDADVRSQWTCTGFEDRTTTRYPRCPRGSDLVRIFDFPSCWDGENLDSEDHKSHIVFPDEDGSCGGGTVAVPRLRMSLTYERPDGDDFALDSFPDQRHDPRTDHGQFENLMPEELMEEAVDCINRDRDC